MAKLDHSCALVLWICERTSHCYSRAFRCTSQILHQRPFLILSFLIPIDWIGTTYGQIYTPLQVLKPRTGSIFISCGWMYAMIISHDKFCRALKHGRFLYQRCHIFTQQLFALHCMTLQTLCTVCWEPSLISRKAYLWQMLPLVMFLILE